MCSADGIVAAAYGVPLCLYFFSWVITSQGLSLMIVRLAENGGIGSHGREGNHA